MSYPDDNPKTAVGATKVPLHLVPPSAIHHLALAFKDGAAKYGPYNWRDQKVSSSVYVGAATRHIGAWWDGENLSADALVEHLAHVMACCAIILDAASVGMLNDDRPTKGATSRLHAQYLDTSTKHVKKTPESVHDEIAETVGIETLAHHIPHWHKDWGKGVPAESSYLASFSPNGSRIATAAEIEGLRDYLTAEELKGFGIGDVHPLRHAMLDERTPEDRL